MTERTAARRANLLTELVQDPLRLLSVVIAVLGLAVAGYLSYVAVTDTGQTMSCPASDQTIFGLPIDCGLVDASVYARLGPIPVAVLGFGGYLVILLVLLLETRVPLLVEYGRLAFFGLTLFGFAFSAYLTWAEVAQIRAFCTWCVVSAVLMTVLFIIALVRLRQSLAGDTA